MRRRSILIALGAIFSLAVVIVAIAARPVIAIFVRLRLENILKEHFKSRIEFASFRVAFGNGVRADMMQVALYLEDRMDVPPLIRIEELSIDLQPWTLLRGRLHFSRVYLKGLQITIPPRALESPPILRGTTTDLKSKYPVMVELLRADDAKLTILRGQPGASPLEFLMHHLDIAGFSFDGPAKFKAKLTNAVPRGEIYASGLFGPWDAADPRSTLVQGDYSFDQADLGTIRGLQGILSSTGSFSGPLDYLDVRGSTDTPDFCLRKVNNPIALHTDFLATVDGTNGNTYLHSVVARFLHSVLKTHGAVLDQDRKLRARTIQLDVTSENARIEDLIHLAVKTDEPILTGPTRLRANIVIPERDADLTDRLNVSGNFRIDQGRFSDPALQDKVDSLSRKGQGQPRVEEISNVPSQLQGKMQISGGVIHFRGLRYAVPGATVKLHGDYAVEDGRLDFHGELLLDAKLSQTTTGAKALLLKAVDPFFSNKNGGSRIPIKITGTRQQPQFGMDRGRSTDGATQSGARRDSAQGGLLREKPASPALRKAERR